MKVFAISDLHLSGAVEKPMDIFGDGWQNHFDKVKEDWLARVGEEDLVLLGGDMSWGLTIDQAAPDYAAIAALPGKKAVVKGNHDYYWSSLSKMREAFEAFGFIQNNCLRYDGYLVAGSRGWNLPCEGASEQDLKIYARELQRLELSLKCAQEQRREGDTLPSTRNTRRAKSRSFWRSTPWTPRHTDTSTERTRESPQWWKKTA